jgi:outer membrane lipoprotein-sorting protein
MRRMLAAASFAALLAVPAAAQTVDEIIAKNIAARGGMEKIRSVQTMRMTGTMKMGQGMEAPITIMAKRPNRSRVEFTIQGMTGVQAFDGKTAWSVMPFAGRKDPEASNEEESRQTADQADFDGPLVDYAAKGNKVELLGKDKLEGTDAWKIKLTLPSGATRTVWIDAETFLELGSDGKRTMRGTEVPFKATMSDYKDVSGMLVAHTMQSEFTGPHGSMTQTMSIDKVELNVAAPDSLFNLPAGAKAAAPPPAAAPAAGASSVSGTPSAASATAKADSATTAGKTKKATQPSTKKP